MVHDKWRQTKKKTSNDYNFRMDRIWVKRKMYHPINATLKKMSVNEGIIFRKMISDLAQLLSSQVFHEITSKSSVCAMDE